MRKIIILLLLLILPMVTGLQLTTSETWKKGQYNNIQVISSIDTNITINIYDPEGILVTKLTDFDKNNDIYYAKAYMPYNYEYETIIAEITLLDYKTTQTIKIKQLTWIEEKINWLSSYVFGARLF